MLFQAISHGLVHRVYSPATASAVIALATTLHAVTVHLPAAPSWAETAECPAKSKSDRLNLLMTTDDTGVDGELPAMSPSAPLQALLASGNRLTGAFSLESDGLQSLIILDLSENNLQGSVPDGLALSPFLVYCDLARNAFGGEPLSSLPSV